MTDGAPRSVDNGVRGALRTAIRWAAILLLLTVVMQWSSRVLVQRDVLAEAIAGQWWPAGLALLTLLLRLALVLVLPAVAAAKLAGWAVVWLMERRSRDGG